MGNVCILYFLTYNNAHTYFYHSIFIRVKAKAYCCDLTDWGITNSDCESPISSISADNDDAPTSITCSNGYTLFGCTYIGESRIDGGCVSTTTDCNPSQHGNKPIRCVGRDGETGNGGITSRARCCKSSFSYANADDLECIIQYSSQSINSVGCPNGYFPLSCNGYGPINKDLARSEFVWGMFFIIYSFNN